MPPTRCVIVLLAGLAVTASVPVASGGPVSPAETGTLALRAVLPMAGQRTVCPAGTRSTVECYARRGEGIVPGLGKVSHSYVYPVETQPPACPSGDFRILSYGARLTVAGRGEIDISLRGSTACLSLNQVLTPVYPPFTITGGSGAYAGASGSGTLVHAASFTEAGAAGTDTWVGTLTVPGLDFDVAPPTLTGAVGKTVRAPRGAKGVRVTYSVTARDDVDGAVRVSCQPRSGAVFKIGRTVVSCSATDTSGNTVSAKFAVTVKARK